MRYNPYSLADRLEKADILANEEIMEAMLDELGELDELDDMGDSIRAMSPDNFKHMWKLLFIIYYQELTEEAANIFEQACKDYNAERDGIENDPRKKFRPKTEFEIEQELAAYFVDHGPLH